MRVIFSNVGRLQEQVIDLEVENGTPSPTIDPSIKVVLLAHSMGGLVGADTILSIVDDKPVSVSSESDRTEDSLPTSKDPRIRKDEEERPEKSDVPLLFPSIAGLCSFDTPFLGLAPSMFANSADSNYKAASEAFAQVSSVASALGIFGAAKSQAEPVASEAVKPVGALPAPPVSQTPGWQWGKIAAFAGAASTVAVGATAAYLKRTEITQGFSWVSSHLEFISVLMKINELKTRVVRIADIQGVGVSNFYTILGKGAEPATTAGGKLLNVGGDGVRTFCSLPAAMKNGKTNSNMDQRGTTDIDLGTMNVRKWWHPARNETAKDEVNAHIGMFHMSTNPAYKELLNDTRLCVLEWTGAWCEVDTA